MKVSASPAFIAPRRLPSITAEPSLPEDSWQPSGPRREKEWGEKILGWVGSGAQGVAMVPKFLESNPKVVEFFNLEHLGPAIQTGATAFGGLATASLTASGAMDLSDGLRHNNAAEVFSGLSSLTQAGYVGAWTGSMWVEGAWDQGLRQVSHGAGLVSGAFEVAAGLARLTHEKRPDNPVNPKLVGLMEAGMGAAWMGSMLGAPVGVCWAVRGALATAKVLYTHREKWQAWTHWEGRG